MTAPVPTYAALADALAKAKETIAANTLIAVETEELLARLYRALQGDALDAALAALPLHKRIELRYTVNSAFDLLSERGALVPA